MSEKTDKKTAAKDYLAKNSARLVPKIMKLFNKMDGRCRQLCISNPSRPMSDYCKRCQDMFEKELGDDIK